MRRPATGGRKGAIAPLTAILLIPLVAMLAFAVDMGYITHTHNQLQAAADAAALAGANQLIDNHASYHLGGTSGSKRQELRDAAVASARSKAKAYAAHNGAGDLASLALLDGDVELGFTDASGHYTPLASYSGYPNTVKVALRRDASANGALPMFFARVLGINTVNLKATATAAVYAGQIDGFSVNGTVRSRILPMTYDVNSWNDFLKGTYQPWMVVDNDASGVPRLAVYPSKPDRGNFGELSLDQSNAGASTISGWIDNGVTQYDLQASYSKGLLPLSSRAPNAPPEWKGNPGLKNSTVQTVGDHINDLYLLPLFKPVSASQGNYAAGQGQGSNYYYSIVQFVGVRISAVDSKGNPKSIKVQPAAVVDPNALFAGLQPAQPPSGNVPLVTTFAGAKLTR